MFTMPSADCAEAKKGSSRAAAIAKHRILVRAAEQALDLGDVVIFPYQSHVSVDDFPFAINNKGSWERIDAAVRVCYGVVPHHHAVIHLMLRDIGLHRRPSVVVHRDSEHL